MTCLSRYMIILLLAATALPAYAQVDSTADDDEPPRRVRIEAAQLPRQIRFSADISKPVAVAAGLMQNRQAYELMADYHFRKDLYAVAEGGWGNAAYDYPDLSYKTTNTFFRLGIDKSMLSRLSVTDWDMVFVGARYGMAVINRGAAAYTTVDSLWGGTAGTIPAKTITGHWLEVTGGMRVEMAKGFFIGWNIRGRFRVNQKAFRELAPVYIAGYGKGDRNTAFDFNFYLSYALRWAKAGQRAAAPAVQQP